jgi:Toprim domain-containing protein
LGHSRSFLPASGEHPPSMIAAFGLADERESGVLTIDDRAVRGVHVTRLRPDGSARISKATIGRGSTGSPIVLAPPNDLLGLAITEGNEDGLSIHAATGLGVWVAGSAGRMPPLAAEVPSWIEVVNVFGHDDPAGRHGAIELAVALRARGFEVLLKFLRAGQSG